MIYLIETVKKSINHEYEIFLIDSVLKLFVYKRLRKQTIYEVSTMSEELLYLLSTSNESDWQKKNVDYLLKSDWDIAYLWTKEERRRNWERILETELEVKDQQLNESEEWTIWVSRTIERIKDYWRVLFVLVEHEYHLHALIISHSYHDNITFISWSSHLYIKN